MLAVVAGLQCLGGCAVSLAPQVPAGFMQPFQVQYAAALTPSPGKATLPNITDALSRMNADLLAELQKENHLSWYAGDLTLLGVVAAVAGAGTNAIGLRNSGAGVAAAGSTATSHYQVEPAFQAYLTGIKRTSCVQAAVANLPTDIDRTVLLLQASTPNQDDIADFIAAYNGMQTTIYASVNAIRMNLATSVLSARPGDVSTADFATTLQKFKSATVNDSEKRTLGAVSTLMLARVQAQAQADVDSASHELASARSQEKQAALEAASARATLDETDRQAARLGRTMDSEMAIAGTPEARKTELSRQLADFAEQRAKQQALLEARSGQRESATRRVQLAQAQLDAARQVQAKAANANTTAQAQQATLAVEQVKGLAAALTLCNGL